MNAGQHLYYLYHHDDVAALVADYPRLSEVLAFVHKKSRPSRSWPDTPWRVSHRRLATMLAELSNGKAAGHDPTQRLELVEAGLEVSGVHPHRLNKGLRSRDSSQFDSALSEILVGALLARIGFRSRESSPGVGGNAPKSPDFLGTLPDGSTAVVEVYRPAAEGALPAAAGSVFWELHDALKFADLPWHYWLTVEWKGAGFRTARGQRDQDAHSNKGGKETQRRDCIAAFLTCFGERLEAVHTARASGGPLEFPARWGMSASVTVEDCSPWSDGRERPRRSLVLAWGSLIPGSDQLAADLAACIARKAGRGQAQSRKAGRRLLLVDCSDGPIFWDLFVSPDGRVLPYYLEALEQEFSRIHGSGIDGVLVVSLATLTREGTRTCLAVGEVPEELLCAVSGARSADVHRVDGLRYVVGG